MKVPVLYTLETRSNIHLNLKLKIVWTILEKRRVYLDGIFLSTKLFKSFVYLVDCLWPCGVHFRRPYLNLRSILGFQFE